jgi:hypothetical protein
LTSPPEKITVECPQCGHRYEDWIRRSVNLDLDSFDSDYLENCSTATCPKCDHKVNLDVLVVENGVFTWKPDAPARPFDDVKNRTSGMRRVTLADYLALHNVDLNSTYLHVIRDPIASQDWQWASEQKRPLGEALLDATRLDTSHNVAKVWKSATTIAVLLDTRVKFSTLNHIPNSYLFMGVLKDIKRRPGIPNDDPGRRWTLPGWEMSWSWTDGDYLFLHEGLSRGWKFRATGDRSTAARKFTLLGRASVPNVIPTPSRVRGFQLTFDELQTRVGMSNWREFLDAPGVYLIQVFDPSRRDFYRYVGMARRSLRDRWTTYAETGGTAGSEDVADAENKYLSLLCSQMGPEEFIKNWRIQVIRLADTDEVRAVEKEVKESLCTYHLEAEQTPERFRSLLGLNGN